MPNKTEADLAKEAKEEVSSISCKEYETLCAEGGKHVLLDVREKNEFDEGHVEDAVHVPRGVIKFKVGEAIPNKGELIVICCGTGGRAALAGKTLMEMGYTNTMYLEGGYTGYCAAKE